MPVPLKLSTDCRNIYALMSGYKTDGLNLCRKLSAAVKSKKGLGAREIGYG
jgi:hypothetical protein